MREASKTNAVRGPEFKDRYFSGKVLDIGCGPDLVVPHAQPFDMPHGDANRIADYLPAESFDCVHSSHCLEHMYDPKFTIQQWWSLVKPGGFMVFVVPHEDLYEQGIWPPVFNRDHKATFRLDSPQSWSPVSHDVRQLVNSLPGAEIVDIRIHDIGYDHSLRRKGMSSVGWLMFSVGRVRKGVLRRLGMPNSGFDRVLDSIEYKMGKAVDQTQGDAMAQIQAIVRKRSTG